MFVLAGRHTCVHIMAKELESFNPCTVNTSCERGQEQVVSCARLARAGTYLAVPYSIFRERLPDSTPTQQISIFVRDCRVCWSVHCCLHSN